MCHERVLSRDRAVPEAAKCCLVAACAWRGAVAAGVPREDSSVLLQPVNERLRLLGGTAKVALDLLEYESQLERAFITICG